MRGYPQFFLWILIALAKICNTLIGKLLMKRECLGPGAHFSKVPVTFQARSNTLKSKSLERWHSFQSAYQANLFYQL